MPLVLTILLVLINSPVFAESEVYSRVVQKHIKKVRDRWTIEDLYLKRKTPPPRRRWSPWRAPMLEMLVDFKFGPGTLYKTGVSDKDSQLASLGSQLQFHYGALGLGLDRFQTKFAEKNVFYKHDDITLFYRLAGPSTQSTHLTFLVGSRGATHDDYGSYHQQFYGLLANLYLFRHLGFEGQYKVLNESLTKTHALSGVSYHWGVFWEFSILRLYINFSQDYHYGVKREDQQKLDQRFTASTLGARLAF